MKLNISPIGQRDVKWKSKKLGNSTTRTIGSDGCLLICHTMMLNYYGQNLTPDTLNEIYKQNGVFTGALIYFHKPAEVFKDITADEAYNCPTTPCDIAKIDKYLNEKKPVIAWVDNIGNDSSPDHFVLIIGKDENNKYLVNDPWTGETVYFHAVWGDDPARFIYGLRLYSGPVPEDDCQTKLAEAQTNLEKTNQTLADKADEVSILQGEVRDKDSKIQTLKEETTKERDKLNTQLYEKEKEIIELTKTASKVEKLEKNITSLESEKEALKVELTACKKESVGDMGLLDYLIYRYFKRG